MLRKLVVLLSLGLVAANAGPALAAIILNGGFEEGDFEANAGNVVPIPQWGGSGGETVATNDLESDFPHGGFGPHSGSAYAAFGAIDELDSIAQTIDTIDGQVYRLQYSFASDGGESNRFQVMWDSTVLINEIDVPQRGYLDYTFLVMGTGSNTLTFAGRDEAGADQPDIFGYLSLDDVSLTAVPNLSPVPEPSSLTLFLIAGATMLAARMGRRRTFLGGRP